MPTNDLFDRLDVVSPALAQELREAGVKWIPRIYDWFLSPKRRLRLILGEAQRQQIIVESSNLWLPSRRDCEEELWRMGWVYQEVHIRPYGCESISQAIGSTKILYGKAATPAEAVGRALLEAKRKDQFNEL